MDKVPPNCIGIIMDGNRRWAQAHNSSILEGHNKGINKLLEVSQWVKRANVRNLIVYAFSNENWNRSADEVTMLMNCITNSVFLFQNKLDDFKRDKNCIRFIGQHHRLPAHVQQSIRTLESRTEPLETANFVLWVCLSYGGRSEIVEAAKKLQHSDIDITEETFHNAMWSADMPDPDIIIRTGGEMRLSGFLPWACIYSELFFLQTLWPDVSEDEIKRVLVMYFARERRFGK